MSRLVVPSLFAALAALAPPPAAWGQRSVPPLRAAPGAGVAPAALPAFVPRTRDRSGDRLGDPLNLILIGSADAVDAAFARAGWMRADRPTVGAIAKEVEAVLVERPAPRAPVSTQYFAGRPQDLAYEVPGSDARRRHHVRLWALDPAREVWVGAANEDVGVIFKPWKLEATHRIRPDIDRERDRLVRDLEAGGCAAAVAYVRLPGAVVAGRNAAGQPFVTDARTAVVRVRPCDRTAGR
jgi:hypothetical protein